MRTICSREIFTKKCRQQQIFDSDLKGAWHYNHVTFTPIAKHFMLYCRLIYMLSMLYVRLTIKVKLGILQSFKVGWYPHKITRSHLKEFVISYFFDGDTFNSLIPQLGKNFRASDWMAKKPSIVLTNKGKLDASGLYASDYSNYVIRYEYISGFVWFPFT